MTAANKARVSLTINGTPAGLWATSGDDSVQASLTQYRQPDGTLAIDSVRALPQAMAFTRRYYAATDQANVQTWKSLVGRAIVDIAEQDLDDDDIAIGSPRHSQGKLQQCTLSGADVNSDESRTITIEVLRLK